MVPSSTTGPTRRTERTGEEIPEAPDRSLRVFPAWRLAAGEQQELASWARRIPIPVSAVRPVCPVVIMGII
jgi:hypothetical protein